MSTEESPATSREIVPRRFELIPYPPPRPETPATTHGRFQADEATASGWTTYASQRHICAIAVDERREWVWLATWGGVLCWIPAEGRCVRHASEHGLRGSATRGIAVDTTGRVWAASRSGGLASLHLVTPDAGAVWQPFADLRGWQVLNLAPRDDPMGGISVSLIDAAGRGAVGEIAGPQGSLRLVAQGSEAVQDIETLWIGANAIWTGNLWGLHCNSRDGAPGVGSIRGPGGHTIAVHALAGGGHGSLWCGTRHGLYRFDPATETVMGLVTDGPRDEIAVLIADAATGEVWTGSDQGIAHFDGHSWQTAVPLPNGRPRALAVMPGTRRRVWTGGTSGVYEIEKTECKPAITFLAEDDLSNAVQCLCLAQGTVWAGTARGLSRFVEESWQTPPYTGSEETLRDVRALIAEPVAEPVKEPGEGRLWIGTGRGALGAVQRDVYIPDHSLGGPVVAFSADRDRTLWIATADAIFRFSAASRRWQLLDDAVRERLRGREIRTLWCQTETTAAGQREDVVWVGTSGGLLRYRPAARVWTDPQDWSHGDIARDLNQYPVRALAIGPHDNRLWIGTARGLFRQSPWQRHDLPGVQALAFAPDATLWVGTTAGLWRFDRAAQEAMDGKGVPHFTALDSGLSADVVTSLLVRTDNAETDIWVGTTAGISRYRER
jgi:ligand-binding sensor domain-containing protein